MKAQDNEPVRDPFQCSCGPCKKFWKSTFSSNGSSVLQRSPSCRASDTAFLTGQCQHITVGSRVTVKNKYTGAVRYVGFLENNKVSPKIYVGVKLDDNGAVRYVGFLENNKVSPKIYVGVKLDDNVNSVHNGVHKGKRYFHCPRGHGSMVKYTEVQSLPPANRKPPVSGNYMFPSYDDIKRRRKLRAESISSLYSSCSGGSTMSGQRLTHSGRKTPLRRSTDPRDMVYQDRRKQERERQRFQQLAKEQAQVSVESDPSQAKLAKWKQEFGGDERAARMAETLQKLHLAYEEGLKLQENDQTGEMNSGKVNKISFKT